MDEWRDSLTSKQLDLLKTLKSNVADVDVPTDDDFFYFRYLKARRFDVKKAEEMLRKSMEWRKSYGADTILSDWEPPEVLRDYWPGGMYGYDKEGHPILWQLSKDFDSKTMIRCARKSDIIKYHIWRMEKVMKACEEQTKKLNKRIYNAVNISDLDGFSLGMLFTPGINETLKQAFALYEANYPERLHTSYVINAPSVFPAIFNILKPFLSEDTKKKVHILGRNWKEVVFKSVDPSQIPTYWGGTAVDPDDRCTNHVNHCHRPIPKEFLLSENIHLDADKLENITVMRGNTYNLFYTVKQPNTVITWVFESDEHDIGFGVYRTGNMDQWKAKVCDIILPIDRVNSHLAPEAGSITCQRIGMYVLQFDNTFSWVNSKTVRYEVEVLDPDEDVMYKNDHEFVMKHQLRNSNSSHGSSNNYADALEQQQVEVTHL